MRMTLVLGVAIWGLVGPFAANAEVPAMTSYQGVLRDEFDQPVPDGDYEMTFRLYDAPIGGEAIWVETRMTHVTNGIFGVLLGASVPLDLPFDQAYWLGVAVGTAPEMEPRVQLAAAPYALRARIADAAPDTTWTVAAGDAYRLTGDVGIGTSDPQARLDVVGTTRTEGLTMAAGAAAGYVLTSDADGNASWQLSQGGIGGAGTTGRVPKFIAPTTLGDSMIGEASGEVSIGESGAKVTDELAKQGGAGARAPRLQHQLGVYGVNSQSLYAELHEDDTASDGRAGLYAYRSRAVRNDGTGYALGQANTAITAYNNWGDSYSFGLAAYGYNDFGRTGAILGAKHDGTYWAALAYRDETLTPWGVYTPGSAYVGGGMTVGGTITGTASNADKLDAQHGSFYQDASNLAAGTVAEARLPQNAIDASEIEDGTLVNADVSATASIAATKISGDAWTHADDGYPPDAATAFGDDFSTQSQAWAVVAHCSVNAPASGNALVLASAGAEVFPGDCFGVVALAVDSTTNPDINTVRNFGVTTAMPYETVSVSYRAWVEAGTHEFYFLAKRSDYWPSGTVYFRHYSLSVIYVDR